jgi:aryl-alcohol dehydrogenase-like predicted oxidoreductase
MEALHSTIFRDAPPEEGLPLLYRFLGIEEGRLDEIPRRGWSAEYVRRETTRALAAVAGAGTTTAILPGIDVDIPTGEGLKQTTPEDVYAAVQIRYNVLYQTAWHNILPLAHQLDLGVVMRPLTSGIFGKLLRAARADIEEYLNPSALALTYVLSDSRISTAIVGMRRTSEVEQNNALSDATDRRLDLAWLHERQVPV